MHFNYNGHSNEELLNLVDKTRSFISFSRTRYQITDFYSLGCHIRDYGYYPSWLPLHCYISHGVCPGSTVAPHELDNDANVHFTFSESRLPALKKILNKPCYNLISPFVWYRKKHKIEPSSDAKGVLAFYSHSTSDVKIVSSLDSYISDIKKLRDKYGHVAVCLHMSEINNGTYRLFIENKFPVYTAGYYADYRYAKRWYDIIKHFKYTTSNTIGSYTMYSVEMGIPFFIYGDEPRLRNDSDRNLPIGDCSPWHDPEYIYARNLFVKEQPEITAAQKEFVESQLCINNTLSRKELAVILYKEYFKCGNILKDIERAIRLRCKFLRKRFTNSL